MLKNISILTVTAVFLAACGSSGALSGFGQLGEFFARAFAQDRNDEPLAPVSYTHLTLPTICSV